MEEFFNVLTGRGVKIASSEQAVALGNAVAEMAGALGMVEDEPAIEVREAPVGAMAGADWSVGER
jgi:hypothetical protein